LIGSLESYNRVLCSSQVEETLEHLFFHCPFASSCWDLLTFNSSDALSRFQVVEDFRLVFNRFFFMEFFILEHLDREKRFDFQRPSAKCHEVQSQLYFNKSSV